MIHDRGSNKKRKKNIAEAIVSNFAEWSKCESIRIKDLRNHIISRSGMDKLEGKSKHGDMKAHGDACGGKGLMLDIIDSCHKIMKDHERSCHEASFVQGTVSSL